MVRLRVPIRSLAPVWTPGWSPVWALIRAAVALLAIGSAAADPQDGPHVDIRITVTDRDARFAIGMNLPFVDAAAPTQREAPDDLDPTEEEAVFEAIRDLIRTANAVEIDGVDVQPVFERMSVERLDESMMGLFPETGRAALTRFSLLVVYPFKAPPDELRFRWGAFPVSPLGAALDGMSAGDTPPVMTINGLIIAEGRVSQFMFSESEPWHTWRPDGKTIEQALKPVPPVGTDAAFRLPVISAAIGIAGIAGVGLRAARRRFVSGAIIATIAVVGATLTCDTANYTIGAEPLTPDRALAVFEPLHANIYRAFDYSTEDDIYDALAASVAGPLLRDLYTQISTGLVQAENDGAIGRVTDVALLDASPAESGFRADGRGFAIDAEWEVEGTVYHFGHSHAKRRRFQATFRVEPIDGRWRITEANPAEVTDLRPTEL